MRITTAIRPSWSLGVIRYASGLARGSRTQCENVQVKRVRPFYGVIPLRLRQVFGAIFEAESEPVVILYVAVTVTTEGVLTRTG